MTTGLPLVSIVIPTYNRWPMVGEAVNSVLGQSYKEFELIVVDDGSTDMTVALLRRRDRRLTIVSQPRAGVAAARNAGVAMCRGKYIAFLDSDDLWLPSKLAIQAEFMEQTPGAAICQTEEIWIRNGMRVNPKVKHRKPAGDIFRRSLELCLVSPSAVIITRELFYRAGRFDETFPVCEDYDLWLRIAVEHPISLIDTPLVIKRGGHADQLSRSVWGMDRFRVSAIVKLLRAGLVGEKKQWALEVLRQKIAILAAGARKRGRQEDAGKFEHILAECFEEPGDVGTNDSGICRNQRISFAHSATLA